MKNLKFGLLAIALVAGIGSAIAFTIPSPCQPSAVVLTLPSNAEAFQFAGAIAADQTLENYQVRENAYDCLLDDITCTYYVDPADGKIKQCEEGRVQ